MADKSAAGLKLLLEYQQLPVEEQAKVFLRTFVMDFRGNFDEILTLAERFATYRTRKPTDEGAVIIKNLEEADLYRFLEGQGHPISAAEFRTELKKIDIEIDRNATFIAYCIWHYKKTLAQLVIPPGEADPALLKILEEALAAYQKVVDARKARDAKIAQLRVTIAGGGVKGNVALAELQQMEASDQLERNKAEITSAAKRRAAQKAVEKGSDGAAARERAMREEEKKLELEKKKKEEEEKRIQEEKRAKLKAKSAMFEQAGAAAAAPPPVVKSGGPSKKWGGAATTHAAPTPAPAPVQHTPVQHAPAPVHVVPQPAVTFPTPPAPPAGPPTEKVKALYAYTANSPTELTFQAGDIITIFVKDPGGWWEGGLDSGARGWLPSAYVQAL